MSQKIDFQSSGFNGDLAEIEYQGTNIKVARGTTIDQLMKLHPDKSHSQVIAAIVNNRAVSLSAQILRSGTVDLVPIQSRHGVRIYRRHLTMMLYEVFHSTFKGSHIQIGQSISEGYYFEITGTKVDSEFLKTLKTHMKALCKKKLPFVYSRVPIEEARRIFFKKGATIKRQILDQWHSSHVGILKLGNFVDFCFGPVAPHSGFFSEFTLLPIDNKNFILQFPNYSKNEIKRNEQAQPKLYETHKRSKSWCQQLGISHVGALNSFAINKDICETIKIAEGQHEKRISEIAEIIATTQRKLIFIAGPSSAGKTTFSKRLSIQLKVASITPKALSLDNYYVNRTETPMDKNGNYDFEALEAIDLKQFNQDLCNILDGKKVMTPVFDFQTGKRVEKNKWIPIELKENEVLICEGIHGLNDALTTSIPLKDKFKIYINALNPLSIDEHNRLHTSDVRLIRRLVRDRHYRGYSAAQTINSWPSVRRGEKNHIFPFQESADIIFDTSLIYEFSVLKIFADRYLLEVKRKDPAYAEAYRLRKFLSLFVTVLPGDIPQTSLIREFIGGSNFSY